MRTSPTDVKKLAMGYTPATQRPCCRNCSKVKQATPSGAINDLHPWRCIEGGFGTEAEAACTHHNYATVASPRTRSAA